MITLSIWLDGKHVKDYIVGAVPGIGHMLVLDRRTNLRVVDVIWSLSRQKGVGEALALTMRVPGIRT